MTPGQEALIEAMRLEQARVYGTTVRETASAEPAVEPSIFGRPADTYRGPAPAAVIEQLVDALDVDAPRVRVRAADRRSAEQAIARGLDDDQVAAVTHLEVASVRRVRAAMDRAAS